MTGISDLQRRLEPWGEVRIGAELGGSRNRIWSVRVRGEHLIARLSSRHPGALDWELDLLETLRRLGFKVPVPVPTISGERRVAGLTLFSFLPGGRPESRRDWRRVRDELSRLHHLTRGRPQRPGFRTSQELITEDVGGDVDLSILPRASAELCRRAWSEIQDEQASVVHGDPSPDNIVIEGDEVGLLDWDEARIDLPAMDLGTLDDPELAGLTPEHFRRARRAAVAWEVAVSWRLEPEYARRRLDELRRLSVR